MSMLEGISLPDGSKGQTWPGDWLTGAYRKTMWARLVVLPENPEAARLAADLFLDEGKMRHAQLLATIAHWDVDDQRAVPTAREDAERLNALDTFLRRVRERYHARFVSPPQDDLRMALLTGGAAPAPDDPPWEPLAPAPPAEPPAGSPRRPPAPKQGALVDEPPTPPPPLGRLALRTRGGTPIDARGL